MSFFSEKNNVQVNQLSTQLASNANNIYELNNLYKPVINNAQKTAGITHILAGIDSLSNGAGGSAWPHMFRDRAYGEFGCGGIGYIGFHNTQVVEFGSWNNNLKSIVGTQYQEYSFDAKGLYWDGTGDHIWLYLDKDYTDVKIVYLKMPNGGSFNASWMNEPSTVVTTNTNNTEYDLGVVELKGNNATRKGYISINGFTGGNVVLYGMYATNSKGIIVSKIGLGGDKFAKHADLNDAFREKWLDIFKPDYLLLNAGTNDNQDMTADTYATKLAKYLLPFKTKNTNIVVISPNKLQVMGNMVDFEKKMIDYAKNNKVGFFAHHKLLGASFEEANSLGYMLDGAHPNALGNQKISNFWLSFFGIPLIGTLKSNASAWGAAGELPYYYKNPLTIKDIQPAIGAVTEIYNIGLTNAYAMGLLTLKVTGHREGTAGMIEKEIKAVVGNTTTTNQVTSVSNVVETTKYSFNPDAIVTDFTVTLQIVNGKLSVKITDNTSARKMRFHIEGEIILTYLTNRGPSVFENATA